MAINISDLNLSEITEEFLIDQCIDMGMDLNVDTNQGSIYRDASDGHIIRTAKFFNDLRMVNEIISINTCTGEVLDEKLRERGMQRNPPESTSAVYYAKFVGAEPEEGDVMSCADHFFTAEKLNDRWAIRSEEVGAEMNSLVPGLPIIPEIDVDNLVSATLEELAIPALEVESDDSARQRFIDKVSGPSENGNKAQVRSWCEAIEGVGRARIVPLWNGKCTALGVIISTAGTKPDDSVVELVQKTIDPDAAGMGEGLATIGCFFTAVAAEEVKINVSVSVTKGETGTYSQIQTDLQKAVTEHLRTLVLDGAEEVIVRYSAIGSLISQVKDVIDYEDLLVNGKTENISCTIRQIPVIGEVTVNGSIL